VPEQRRPEEIGGGNPRNETNSIDWEIAMSNYYDASNAMDDLGSTISDGRNTDLEGVNSWLDDLDTVFNRAESELNYCADDFEELEQWRECGKDIDEINTLDDEAGEREADIRALQRKAAEQEVEIFALESKVEELEAKPEVDPTEYANLKLRNENQQVLILACFNRLREIGDMCSVNDILNDAYRPDVPLLTGPEGQGHA
jgi:chromosome segregation ATPase